MRRAIVRILTGLLVLPILMAVAGCEGFPNEEMNIVPGEKNRPLAIICDPPDLAPGNRTQVALYFHAPSLEDLSINWQVALDYNMDIYDEIITERHIVDLSRELDIDPPLNLPSGIARQSFSFTVPDSTLLYSSAIPDLMSNPFPPSLRESHPEIDHDPLSKAAVDHFLKTAIPQDLTAEEREFVNGLADRFACQIRFRAKLRGPVVLDVTKNLTIRHSAFWHRSSLNQNPSLGEIVIISVQHPDVDDSDEIYDYPHTTTRVRLRLSAVVTDTIPFRDDWTYYVEARHDLRRYVSPLGSSQVEDYSYRWYYTRIDDNGPGGPFYVADDGDEVGMDYLGNRVRLQPDVGTRPETVRLFLALRNYRPEWHLYHYTPGVAFGTGQVMFLRP